MSAEVADDGDPPVASFEEFYAAHFSRLTLQLFAYTGDLVEAQDLVQEAFCRALERWQKVSGYHDPVAWTRKVAWNLATSRWRRRKVAQTHLAAERLESVPGPGPERVALMQALATLPPVPRKIFALFHIADMSIVDIAAQEHMAEGTVKSTLHRARAALAKHLAERKESRYV